MDLIARALRLEQIANDVGESDLGDLSTSVRERYAAGNTLVVVCGEFNRGKSSLVNALLGTALPTDVLPTTAALHVLHRSESASLTAVWRDGGSSAITPAELDAFRAGGDSVDRVRFVRVGVVGSDLLESGAVFVDTPGVNDLNAQRVEVTYEFLPQADVAIFLLDGSQAVTRSEAEFLTERLWHVPGQTVIFVLNKIDQLDAEEQEESLAAAHERLLEVTRRNIVVLPISARTGAGLAELNAELLRAIAVAREQAGRLFQARIEGLASSLKVRIAARASLLEANAVELESRQREVFEAQKRARATQEAFTLYVQSFGRDTLVPMVQQSLRVLRADVTEDLSDALRRSADPDEFQSADVPTVVHRRLRGWAEQKQPEVTGYLRQFNAKLAQEFHRAFEAPLEHAILGRTAQLARSKQADTMSPDGGAKQTEFVVSMGMKVVASGALFAMGLGPMAAMIGMGVGELGSRAWSSQRLAQRRDEVAGVLPGTIGSLFDQYEQALVGGLNLHFTAMEDTIHRQLEIVLDRGSRTLAKARAGIEESQGARLRKLSDFAKLQSDIDDLAHS